MPTISGMRRRGYTPAAVRKFCETIGITKHNSLSDVALLEHAVRDDLNKTSSRFMAVLDPVRLVIENYPEGQVDELDAVNNPEEPSAGTRKVPFSKTLLIERADFMEIPEKKYFRLTPGQEVRLRWGYFVTCTGCKKDAAGNVSKSPAPTIPPPAAATPRTAARSRAPSIESPSSTPVTSRSVSTTASSRTKTSTTYPKAPTGARS